MPDTKRPESNGVTVKEYFSQERIAFMREVNQHRNLIPLLEQFDPKTDDGFIEILTEVSAYCEVILDGYYTASEIDNLCKILYFKLKEKAMCIVTVAPRIIH